MKCVQWFIFPLAFIAYLIPVSVQAQTGSTPGAFANVYIKIQVRNPDGMSASRGILIQLESAEGGIVDQCTTGAGGFCQFNPRTTGLYVLRLKQPGYEEIHKQVDLRDVRGTYLELRLKPESGNNESSALKDENAAAVSAADLAVPDNARKEFEAGQKALEAQDLDSGIAHLQKAIKLYDPFPRAYTMLGGAYVEEQKYSEAQAALQKALQLDPKAVGAYIELGAAFNQMKKYSEAEKSLNQGLELDPDSAAAHYELAKTLIALGRWQEAEPHAVKALAKLPNVPPVHVMMGNILLKKHDAKGALHEFEEYLRLAPNGSMAPAVREIVAKIQTALKTQ
jgi:tetratricopeptide (TPR) repeat protein